MFLIPGAKLAQKADVNSALYNAIATSRGESAAANTVTACRKFQTLRAALHEPPTTEATRAGIKRYLAALNHVSQTTAISELPVALLWVNAFDGNNHCALHQLEIDRVSALFNLAVCEASLAVVAYQARRTDPTATRVAAKAFQVAAGYFRAAAALPTPGGIRAVTSDLYPQTLRALEMAMLGNAQQMLYLITKDESQNRSAFLARFAVGARDFYAVAKDSCRHPDVVNTCINGLVGKPAAALETYFDCVAESMQASACGEAHDMPQQLTRLTMAKASVDAGLQTIRSLDVTALASVVTLRDELITALEQLRANVYERDRSVQEENRQIYFASPATSVSEIAPRQSVKSAPVMEELQREPVPDELRSLDNLPEPGTTQPELSGVAARYAEIVAHCIADEVASLTTQGSRLQEVVVQTGTALRTARAVVPATDVETNPSNSSERDERAAIEAVRWVHQRGGMRVLRELQAEVINMAGETKVQINSIESLLHTEDSEDRQLRVRIQVTRPPSYALTGPYTEKLRRIRGKMEQAANADKIVASQTDFNADAIAAVDRISIAGFEPPSANSIPTGPLQIKRRTEALVAEIGPQIATAKTYLAEKEVIVQEFEKKKHLENPYAVTAGITDEATEIEQCTEAMEREYGALKKRAAKCRDNMESATGFLSDAGVRLRLPPPSDGTSAAAHRKMTEIYKLQAPAQKFRELMGHLEQGTNFYSKEQDEVSMLKRDVEGFVTARRTEARELSENRPSAHDGSNYPPGGGYYGGPDYPPGAGDGYSGGANHSAGRPGQHPNTFNSETPYNGRPGAWGRQ